MTLGLATLGLALVAVAACGGGSSKGSTGSSATGVSGSSVAKFCNDANATFAKRKSRLDSNLAPLGKSDLTSFAAQFRTLAGEAPAQVSADLTTMAAFYDKSSINGIDSGSTAATNENAAEDRVSAWRDQNCG